MKIITVVGARPQFIKAAALSRELERSGLHEIIVHTGQHFDQNMSEVFFEEMNIPKPAYNLEIHSLSHGAMTGRMLEEIEKVLLAEKPDMVLVYGDTNSTLAGALAAKKLHIRVGHVEAGLRSFNMAMPEEVNRILTDRISDFLFCPTQTAVQNLEREGYRSFGVRLENTGDIMLDAALYYSAVSPARAKVFPSLGLQGPYILATVHRAENTDDLGRLRSLLKALNDLQKRIPVVCPLHPRTQKIIEQNALKADFTILGPVGYFDMMELIKASSLVITDSGGLQKEAFFFSKPCVTVRDQTEWTELVEHGYNRLAGTDPERILSAVDAFLAGPLNFSHNLYGDGHAASRIVNVLQEASRT